MLVIVNMSEIMGKDELNERGCPPRKLTIGIIYIAFNMSILNLRM